MVKEYLPLALITILGAKDEKVNFTTVGDVAIAGLNPKLIMISVHKGHYITGQIQSRKLFSVNVPDMSMLDTVRFCAEHSGHETDKGVLCHGLWKDIPYLKEAGQVHFCKVISEIRYESRVVFVGAVMETLENNMKEVLIYTLDHRFHRFTL